jgi:hypothetical protein
MSMVLPYEWKRKLLVFADERKLSTRVRLSDRNNYFFRTCKYTLYTNACNLFMNMMYLLKHWI